MGRPKNLMDQQTQTPGDGVTVALRAQLKNATRNIKNRWSSSGADGAAIGAAGAMGPEEAQCLLNAAEAPNETPTHKPWISPNTDPRNILPQQPPPPYPPPVAAIPPTAQLQRAINHTLQSSFESNMLSKSTHDPLVSTVKERTETIC